MSDTVTHKPVSLQPAISGQLSPPECTALYQRFIKAEQESILAFHNEGGSGMEVSRARSKFIDILLSAILEATVNSHNIDNSPIALVAVGG